MAIAPSNNLLNALSQLQSNRPTASAARPASSTAEPSFSAQLSRVAAPAQSTAVGEAAPVRPQTQAPASDPSQSRPRSRYLGQYVNILV
jgi:hypothetical protein